MADRRNRVSIECEWSKNTGVIRQPRGRISSNFFCEYTHKATWNRLVEIHTELSYSTFHLLPFQIVSRRWPFLRISNSLSERRRLIESGSKKDRRFKNTRREKAFASRNSLRSRNLGHFYSGGAAALKSRGKLAAITCPTFITGTWWRFSKNMEMFRRGTFPF